MRRRSRWWRLLLIPALGSVHACDCGSCFDFNIQPVACGQLNNCAIGGQCALEGGTCPSNFRLDTTMACDDAGTTFCCNPLPPCEQLGGACQAGVPGAASSCAYGELQGDCGDQSVCCVIPPPAEASMDVLEPPSGGSCNGAPCASGCDCEPSSSDAGGGVCLCSSEDAATHDDAASPTDAWADGEPAPTDAVDDGEPDDASDSASTADQTSGDANADTGPGDGAVSGTDASLEASVPSDAATDIVSDAAQNAAADADAAQVGVDAGAECGVIICGADCVCVSQEMSACVCP
jgi:hypothetical protein